MVVLQMSGKTNDAAYYALILIFVGFTLYLLLTPNFFGSPSQQPSAPIITTPTRFPSVNLTILTSSQCRAFCDTTEMEETLRSVFVSLNIKRLDIESQEGREFAMFLNLGLVPAYVFDFGVRNSPAFQPFSPNLRPVQDKYVVSMVETASGYVFNDVASEEPSIILFIASYDPHSLRFLNTTVGVLNSRFNGSINFSLRYVVSDNNGTLSSVTGPVELIEDAIHLCALNTSHPNAVNSIVCRAREILSCYNSSQSASFCAQFWKACLSGWSIDVNEVEQCVRNHNSTILRREEEFSRQRRIGAVPTMIIGNRYRVIGGLTQLELLQAVCAIYPGLEGCVFRAND
ncbi:hypothetical protein HY571_00320 [Candidatus Micrarchaeota archaeon]|nr:hypothetical protein [Candidatus Micrarchaeota archaeon]